MPVGIWAVSGRSGAGKTTLLSAIRKMFPRTPPLKQVTTRPERKIDIPGEAEYVSEEEFLRRKDEGEFLWPVEVHGFWRGLPKKNLDMVLKLNSFVIIDIAFFNAANIFHYCESCGFRERARLVYLDIGDEDELRRRITTRGYPDDVERRIIECREWGAQMRESKAPFHIIDATQPKQVILKDALRFFLS